MSAPVPVRVTRYRCPHCPASRSKRAAAQAHVDRCWHNPDTRACKTCDNFEEPGGGEQCIPGRDCGCNVYDESCAAGVGLGDGIVSGCPQWSGRPGCAPATNPTSTKEN